MLGIHRNPNWKEFLKSCESFLRKSPFCTFFCINPGFGEPWDKIWIFFLYCHLHNASKECFWPNFFLNFMHRFKSAILAIFTFCQNGTFEPVHEIQKFFLPKDFFWGIKKVPFTKNIHNFFKGPSNQGFRSIKFKLRLFSKRTNRISKILFNLGSCEFLARLESQIRKCLFFDGSIL